MPETASSAGRKRDYHIPAESIRRSLIESSLGLHLLTSGMVYEGILVCSCCVAAIGLLVYVSTHTSLDLDPYCCYPAEVPPGHLGACSDPSAPIHTASGVMKCASQSITWIRLLYISFYLFLLDWFLIFLFDVPFQYYVERQTHNAYIYGTIWDIQWYVAIYGPSAILLGAHNYILQRKAVKWLHLGCGLVSIAFVLLFVFIALPMDDAWGCYGNVAAASTNDGMCNDANSIAFQRGKRDSTLHAPVYWWCLGFMASFLFLTSVFYFISITNLRHTLWERATRYAHATGTLVPQKL